MMLILRNIHAQVIQTYFSKYNTLDTKGVFTAMSYTKSMQ